MAHSAESSSQDEHSAYKEKDVSTTQNDNDADLLPTLPAQPTSGKPDGPIITAKSKGVIGMELLASRLNKKYFILLYGGFILLAYTLSLGEFVLGIRLDPCVKHAFSQINTHPAHTTPMRPPRRSKHILCSRPSMSSAPSFSPSPSLRWPRSPTSSVESTPTSSVSSSTCWDTLFRLRLQAFM